MSEKKAGFIALVIMLLFILAGTLFSLLLPKAINYICYGLSVFGIAWLYRAAYCFIQKDDRRNRSTRTEARK